MNNSEYEFWYLEFIRNPQLDKALNSNNTILANAQFIALDYFDFIYTKQADSLIDCMVSENDIPCEAYQSIGLFRKKDPNNGSALQNIENVPFLAIIQITITPETYKFYENDYKYNDDIKELEDIISEAEDNFSSKDDTQKIIKCSVYQTINTMDYCIVVKTNQMDFPVYLSNKIKEKQQNSVPKYSVYTNMAISKNFDTSQSAKSNKFIDDDTVLVARVHLKRNIYDEKYLNKFIELSNKERKSKKAVTDTHILTGRYDLSIRINNSKNIINILPALMSFINNSFTGDKNNNILKNINNKNSEEINMLKWLIKNDLIAYVNARIFFNCKSGFCGETNDSSSDKINISCTDSRSPSKTIANQFDDIQNNIIDKISNPTAKYKLNGYMDKLHNIVHIYTALYSRYDTNISINMLGDYLTNFLKLLKMYVHLFEADKININDLSLNFSWGINYLHQFINVVTSVNSSSFEAPKYEAEKDECSVVKLPIAYTEMINEVFNSYYNKRKEKADEEFKYFPKYKPLVIPYMQGLNQNFSMMTLFSQNMSYEWKDIKNDWKNYNDSNEALMYIICEDMNQYKHVSDVIISAMHEVGHYCNAMTREQRNSDALKILADIFSKFLVKRILSNTNIQYDIVYMALCQSNIIQNLSESINKAFIEYFENAMKDFRDYPKNIYLETLYNKISELTYVFADYKNNAAIDDFVHSYLYEAEYMFDVHSEAYGKEKLIEIYNQLMTECRDTAKQLNENIALIQETDNDEKERNEWKSAEKYFTAINNLLNYDLLIDYIDKSPEINKITAGISSIAKQIHFDNLFSLFKKTKQINKLDIAKSIKEDMQYTTDIIKYILKLINNYYNIMLLSKGRQDYSVSHLNKININKKKFIDIILKNYQKTLLSFSEKNNHLDNGYIELFHDLYLCPDSDKNKLCSLLNNSLKDLNVSSETAELSISSYDEGIADTIMCLNLNLDIPQYIIFLSDTYNKNRNNYNISGDRLVIVTAFLFIKKEKYINNEYIDIINKLKADYLNEIKLIKSEFNRNANGNIKSNIIEVLNLIISSAANVFDNKIFKITFNRLKKSYKNMKFINAENYAFVKEMLDLKGKTDLKNKKDNKYQALQNKEIEFILSHYYKNRIKYSALKGGESNECKPNQNRK